MPGIRPRRKATKGEQLTEEIDGELTTYERVSDITGIAGGTGAQ